MWKGLNEERMKGKKDETDEKKGMQGEKRVHEEDKSMP